MPQGTNFMGALNNKFKHSLTPTNYILLQEFVLVFGNPISVNYMMATGDIIWKRLGFIAAADHPNKLISDKLSTNPFYKSATHIVQCIFTMGLVITLLQRT